MQLSMSTRRLNLFTEVVYRRGPRRWLGLRKGHYIRVERPAPWLLGIPLPPTPSITNLALGAPYPAAITLGSSCMRKCHSGHIVYLESAQAWQYKQKHLTFNLPHSHQRAYITYLQQRRSNAICTVKPLLTTVAAVPTTINRRLNMVVVVNCWSVGTTAHV